MKITTALLCGVLGVFSTAAALADSSFLIKPYVFSIHGQRLGLSWQYQGDDGLNRSEEVRIFRGGRLVSTSMAETDGPLHSAVLNMPPCGFGRDVTYQVDGLEAPVPLVEVPCGASDATVRFSFLADAQTNPDQAHEFAVMMKAFPAQAILEAGDLVDEGEDFQLWVNYFSQMEVVGGSHVLFPTNGNHEYRKDPAVPSWKHFFRTEAADNHYSFDLGPAHIIALNSAFEDDKSQIKGQLEWLENELKAPARWKIVFFHHPPFSATIYTHPLAPRKEWKYLQDYYVPLFEQYKVDLVLNGHTHIFETSLKNNVHYVTVGPAGGKDGWMWGENPYMLKIAKVRSIVNLEAAPDHLRAQSVGIDGTVLDDLILR